MSIRVMSKVWDMDLPAKDKLVLLALADCANDEGLAWPSIATLARKCGCDQRTIQRNLRDLEKRGLFKREEVIGKGCRYLFNPRQIVTPDKKSPVTKSTKTPGKLPPKPSVTVNGLAEAKPKRGKHSVSQFEVPDWMPTEPWHRYLKMRDAKKAWPEPDTVCLLISKLARWRTQGHDPGAILDNSTMNNWTGIFEPRKPANDRQPASDEIQNPYVRAAVRNQAARRETERTGVEFG